MGYLLKNEIVVDYLSKLVYSIRTMEKGLDEMPTVRPKLKPPMITAADQERREIQQSNIADPEKKAKVTLPKVKWKRAAPAGSEQ
jgi:hypothetical protein